MPEEALVRAVVEAATRAPSIHNTQPWRFVAHDDVVELWADPERAVPAIDPEGRSRHLSCGAALALARVAAAAQGVATSATVLPDPTEPDHLADLHLGGPHETDADDRALADAIGARHTERGPFDDASPTTADEVAALADAVRREGCWLRVVDPGDDAAAVTVLLARADDVQSAEPAYREELRRWTGRAPDSPDGVPATAVPETPPADRGSSYRLRDFEPDRDDKSPHWADEPPPAEHPLVVVLGSPADDVAAWLAAGQALGRLLLTATVHGLAASPMTQAMEVADTRARLTSELSLVGFPQVVLRVGRAPREATPGRANRRPVDEVLVLR